MGLGVVVVVPVVVPPRVGVPPRPTPCKGTVGLPVRRGGVVVVAARRSGDDLAPPMGAVIVEVLPIPSWDAEAANRCAGDGDGGPRRGVVPPTAAPLATDFGGVNARTILRSVVRFMRGGIAGGRAVVGLNVRRACCPVVVEAASDLSVVEDAAPTDRVTGITLPSMTSWPALREADELAYELTIPLLLLLVMCAPPPVLATRRGGLGCGCMIDDGADDRLSTASSPITRIRTSRCCLFCCVNSSRSLRSSATRDNRISTSRRRKCMLWSLSCSSSTSRAWLASGSGCGSVCERLLCIGLWLRRCGSGGAWCRGVGLSQPEAPLVVVE
eukprot:PhM_4_TR5892/c0_g1_i1/m.67536